MADECGILDTGCKLTEMGAEIAGGAVDMITESVVQGVEGFLTTVSTFWVSVPVSPISDTFGLTGFLRGYLDPFVLFAVTASVMIGAIKLMLFRREAGQELASGLVTIVIVAGISAPLISMLTQISDVFAQSLIEQSTDGKSFGENMLTLFTLTSGGNPILGLFTTLLVGFAAIPTAAIQALLMIVRGVMLPLLAGVLVFSASFFTTEIGKQWFKKSLIWIIAFLAYKPAAAIIYASGFFLIGENSLVDATNAGQFVIAAVSVMQGIALMALAIVALGALIGFVIPVAGKLSGGAAGGMFLASAAGTIAAGAINNGGGGKGEGGSNGGGGPTGASSDGNSGSNGGKGEGGPTGSASPGGPGGAGQGGTPGPAGAGPAGAAGGAGASGAAGAAGGAATAGVSVAGDVVKSGAQAGKQMADDAVGTKEDS